MAEPAKNRALANGPGDGHGESLLRAVSSDAVSVSGHTTAINGAGIQWSGSSLSGDDGRTGLGSASIQSECLGNRLGR